MNIQEALATVVDHIDLSTEQMNDVMRQIMTGGATDAQIGGFLVAPRMKSESLDEITGAAMVMRELVTPVVIDNRRHLVDIVGTGGDGANLFNVSTASAFVAAAAGCRVAKHGNRSVSSKSGSSDLLEEAGIRLDLSPNEVAQCVDAVGVGFMFAPSHHSAMKYAIGPRKELGMRTLFNILGPMTNPAGVKRQLIGIARPAYVPIYAAAKAKLGTERTFIASGDEGLDELSLAGGNELADVQGNDFEMRRVLAVHANLPHAPVEAIRGGDPRHNARALEALLAGTPGPYRDAVLFNAAATLIVADRTDDWTEGAEIAAEALDSGKARTLLESWIAMAA